MTEPRFPQTYCSQCGGQFGPGDSGYSHCDQHADLKNRNEAVVGRAIRAMAKARQQSKRRLKNVHEAFFLAINENPPNEIMGEADPTDLEERADHLQKILAATLVYIEANVDDLNQTIPMGLCDRKYLMGCMSDLVAEVVGTVKEAAENMRERELELEREFER